MFDPRGFQDHYSGVRSRLGLTNHSSLVKGVVRVRPRDIITTVAPNIASLGSIPEEMKDRARIIMADPVRASIIRTVCGETGISLALVMSKSRRKDIVFARHAIWVRWYMAGGIPYRIAKMFEVDHTSVFSAISKHKVQEVEA